MNEDILRRLQDDAVGVTNIKAASNWVRSMLIHLADLVRETGSDRTKTEHLAAQLETNALNLANSITVTVAGLVDLSCPHATTGGGMPGEPEPPDEDMAESGEPAEADDDDKHVPAEKNPEVEKVNEHAEWKGEHLPAAA